jgi:hypothetical protein
MESMARKGEKSLRTKLSNCKIGANIQYSGKTLSDKKEANTDNNISNFNNTDGFVKQHFLKSVYRYRQLRFCKISAKPTLLIGSEIWALRNKDEERLEIQQIKFLRRRAGCSRRKNIRNDIIKS